MSPLILENEIGKNKVLVVDSTLEIKCTVDWTRAVTLVVSEEAYTLIPRRDGSLVRSPSFTMERPLVVCLNKYVARQNRTFEPETRVSHKVILIRDDYTCQYCGKYGDTIDHIMPKSRGGGNTWANLCVACFDCNNAKSDSTPSEAGLKQPVIPTVYSPKRTQMLQTAIYTEIDAMMN